MSTKKYLEAVEKDLQRKGNRQVKPVRELHRAIAKNVLRKGMSIVKALVGAGYSPAQAAKGMAKVRRSYPLRTAFREEAEKLAREKEELAKTMPLDPWRRREDMIVQRLEGNVKAGRDRAVQSCKLLGSHKSLALWEVEYKQGIIIVTTPSPVMPILPVPEDDPE